jgi:hypothetical protein
MSLKKRRKNKANSNESLKPWLISKNHDPWNLRPGFSQGAQFSTNLISNDEIRKTITIIKIFQSKNIYILIKIIDVKFDKKTKLKEDKM